jgi:DNA mismatch repair protein MutL
MRKIEVLDQKTIDKIAAGEVVERPSSVVKELVENAIDAGSTAVTVEIRDGGISFIRITDNGSGIPADQVRMAFLRHATSKIRKVEDLTQIASLGFRGEALSSIAAVSQVELITKTPESLTGIRYRIEGGAEKEMEEIGAPSGTTFLVHHLFYNTPARAKFLKSAAAEGNSVASVVEQLALSHPDISFKYIQNGQNRLYTSGNGQLKEIVYQIYGRELTRELIPVEAGTELMKIRGFIGNPSVARGNRNYENYFVNGRYVKSRLLARAIEDGYHGFMMQHRYPFTLLYLEVDGEKVDVNVHPSKMELRFSQQEEIYHQLCLTVQNALLERERIPSVSIREPERKSAPREKTESAVQKSALPEPFEQTRRNLSSAAPIPPAGRTAVSGTSRKAEKKETLADPLVREAGGSYRTEKSRKDQAPQAFVQQELFNGRLLSPQAKESHRIIGQLFETYWLVEYRDSLYLIDQHAAHEKVLYERMMKEFRSRQITSQMLEPPAVVSLTDRERELLDRHGEVFRRFGFEIEEFGGKEYRICAVPSNLYRVAADQLFVEILDRLEEPGAQTPELIEERLASMSCKAAVKGSQKLSPREAEELISELLTLENPYNCPHGRPTIISMSRHELEKKFRRIL